MLTKARKLKTKPAEQTALQDIVDKYTYMYYNLLYGDGKTVGFHGQHCLLQILQKILHWYLGGIWQHVKINSQHGLFAQEACCSCRWSSPWQHCPEMKKGWKMALIWQESLCGRQVHGPTFNFKSWRSRSSQRPCIQRLFFKCGEEK